MHCTALLLLALCVASASLAYGADKDKITKDFGKIKVVIPEDQVVATTTVEGSGKKHQFLQAKQVVEEKLYDPTTDSYKSNFVTNKGEGFVIGKKPVVEIEFLEAPELVDPEDEESAETGRTIYQTGVTATDKHNKPKLSLGKAYVQAKSAEKTTVDETTDLVAKSEATTGVSQKNIKAPVELVAQGIVGSFLDPEIPDGLTTQTSFFETSEPSEYVKDPQNSIGTLQQIKGEVALVDKETEEIKELLHKDDGIEEKKEELKQALAEKKP